MNTNQPLNEDILLDRLVDGELSVDKRRQLLESFDKRPEGWRRCALAFLEAQSWREELGQLAHNSRSDRLQPTFHGSDSAIGRKVHWSSIATWFAMAASLLVAFSLGVLQRNLIPSPVGGSVAHSGQIAQAPSSSQPAQPLPSANPKRNDAVTLFVKDDSGRMQPIRVPLVDAHTLDKELGMKFQTGVPDDVRNRLKNDGYAVKSKRQYAPLWLENGRPMVLPVEDTNIVPVSNSVY